MGRIRDFLKKRESEGLLRILKPADSRGEGKIYREGKEFVDLSSNDYLGLSTHPKIKDAAREATEKYGTSSSASRLLSGDLNIHHHLEERVANFKGKEAALVFNSGYQANVGIISALYSKGDAIICDRLSHASIIDGILLSGARFFRFNHNDSGHLESILKNNRDNFKDVLIVTETIFSMDGDRPPLCELVELKKRYNCEIMVDEAHATGVFGENGAGVVEEEGLSENIDLVMGTFSKALGSFGAYLACSKMVKDYLINACRSFIYSTALPPSVIAANLAGLDLIKEESFRRKALLENAAFFKEVLRSKGFDVRGSSQIVPLIIGDSQKAIDMSRELQEKGYWALPIRPPTVPSNEARVRFSLTYHHKKELLENLANAICESGCVPAHK
ncbi:MAG: 8-amino-7-oxononanoate synthase [Candidatus Omnitrophica bacterium]|nr:8-amino-7-oxononanoate synthase [Candidatus Omnitrophota bacterium]